MITAAVTETGDGDPHHRHHQQPLHHRVRMTMIIRLFKEEALNRIQMPFV
jgi:hypothetical protein